MIFTNEQTVPTISTIKKVEATGMRVWQGQGQVGCQGVVKGGGFYAGGVYGVPHGGMSGRRSSVARSVNN